LLEAYSQFGPNTKNKLWLWRNWNNGSILIPIHYVQLISPNILFWHDFLRPQKGGQKGGVKNPEKPRKCDVSNYRRDLEIESFYPFPRFKPLRANSFWVLSLAVDGDFQMSFVLGGRFRPQKDHTTSVLHLFTLGEGSKNPKTGVFAKTPVLTPKIPPFWPLFCIFSFFVQFLIKFW